MGAHREAGVQRVAGLARRRVAAAYSILLSVSAILHARRERQDKGFADAVCLMRVHTRWRLATHRARAHCNWEMRAPGLCLCLYLQGCEYGR